MSLNLSIVMRPNGVQLVFFSVLTLRRVFQIWGIFRSETPIETLKIRPISGFFASEVLGSKFLCRISLGVDRDGNGRAGEVWFWFATWGDGGTFRTPWGMRLEVSFLLEVSGNNNWRGSFLFVMKVYPPGK